MHVYSAERYSCVENAWSRLYPTFTARGDEESALSQTPWSLDASRLHTCRTRLLGIKESTATTDVSYWLCYSEFDSEYALPSLRPCSTSVTLGSCYWSWRLAQLQQASFLFPTPPKLSRYQPLPFHRYDSVIQLVAILIYGLRM